MTKNLGPNPFRMGAFVRDYIIHADTITRWMGKDEPEKVRTILESLYPDNVFFREGWFMRIISTDAYGDKENDPNRFCFYMVRGVNIGNLSLHNGESTILEEHVVKDMGKCIIHIPDQFYKYGTFIVLEDTIEQSFKHMSSIFEPDGSIEKKTPTYREQYWSWIQESVYEDLMDMINTVTQNYTAFSTCYPYDTMSVYGISSILVAYNYYSCLLDKRLGSYCVINVKERIKKEVKPMLYQLMDYENWALDDQFFVNNPGEIENILKIMEILNASEYRDPAITLIQIKKIGEKK